MTDTPWEFASTANDTPEYCRHTGHADLLCEAVDGRVGEDPPPGWRPRSERG
jgi:hypothetical protein